MKLHVEESQILPCDFLDIVRHMRKHDPSRAIRFTDAFKSSVRLLSEMPHLGRLRTDLGAPATRSWRVRGFGSYLIFYEVLHDRIRLLRVLHGSRDLQAELGK